MMRTFGERGRDDSGAMMVLYLLVLFILIGLAALAVDLGAVRHDRRQSQLIADLSAASGGKALYRINELDARPKAACQRAWSYFVTNSGSPSTDDPCTSFPVTQPFGSCPATIEHGVGHAGDYRFDVWWPVPDNDGTSTAPPVRYMNDRPLDADIDGANPCERIAVNVYTERDHIFAPAFYKDTPTEATILDGSTGAHAIARARAGIRHEIVPALLVLESEGCKTVDNQGGPDLEVTDDPTTGATGSILVMSTTCSSSSGALFVKGSSSSVTAGSIYIAADDNPYYTGGGAGDVSPNPEVGVDLSSVGRQLFDHKYDCRDDYSDLAPNHPSVPPCPGGTGTSGAISDLRSRLRGTGPPSGFIQPPAFPPGLCDEGDSMTVSGPPVIVPPPPLGLGWYIPCDINVRGELTFLGPAEIVFNGDVDSKGEMTVEDGMMFFRNGHLRGQAGADYIFERTVAVMDADTVADEDASCPSGMGAVFELHSGGTSVDWTPPTSGPFAKLSFWSEYACPHVFHATPGGTMAGIFFAPNADTFKFQGSPTATTTAQVVTWNLEMQGGGSFAINAASDTSLSIEVPAIRLIR